MSDYPRAYTSRRSSIVFAICEVLKQIDGSGDYIMDVHNNVHPRMIFWDEVKTFPALHVVAGPETREYQGGGYKDRFLTVSIWIYVNHPENAIEELDSLLEDVETVIEVNSRLDYLDKKGLPQKTQQMSISQIATDEGALNTQGLAVGEVTVEVRY